MKEQGFQVEERGPKQGSGAPTGRDSSAPVTGGKAVRMAQAQTGWGMWRDGNARGGPAR